MTLKCDLIFVLAATVVQVFHLTPYAVGRSLASKQVGEDEQGEFVCLFDYLFLLFI
jgi:hypothetical protein